MKKISLLLIVILSAMELFAQEGNPFAEYGYHFPVVTATNGRFQEIHDNEEVVVIGTVLFDTNADTIAGEFVPDNTILQIEPQTVGICRFLTPDPLAEKYYHISPYVYVANNPVRYIDPDGRKIVDTNGNVIYTRQGGWVSNAPADAIRIGTALMQTPTGGAAWNFAVNSSTNIQFEISPLSVSNSQGTLNLGNMEVLSGTVDANNKPVVTEAKIVINEGSINDMMAISPQNAKTESYHMNTENNDQRIAAVAGHEITHLTQENLNQRWDNKTQGTTHNIELKPNAVEKRILQETGNRNLKPLIPIQINPELLRPR